MRLWNVINRLDNWKYLSTLYFPSGSCLSQLASRTFFISTPDTFPIRYKLWKESRDSLFFYTFPKINLLFDAEIRQNLFSTFIFWFIIEFAFTHLEVWINLAEWFIFRNERPSFNCNDISLPIGLILFFWTYSLGLFSSNIAWNKCKNQAPADVRWSIW